jgi:branched-chain amino acid transport system substrate-binding protein
MLANAVISMPASPHLAPFFPEMKERYNVEPEDFAPFSYDATCAVLNAIVQANSADPKVFLPALAAIDFDGVAGHIKFDSKGDVVNPPASLFQVKNGDWALLHVMTGQ